MTLHDQHLRSFMDAWNAARAARVPMPYTDNPDCVSMETLGGHVLAWHFHTANARDYRR